MNMSLFYNSLLMVATGDDSKPWLIAICLIVSLAIMVFLFVLGRSEDNRKDNKKNNKKEKKK
ncbi:MAG: hypothetical protein K2G89_05225 [Lachnospiraceae bacterium]|nr:hypothetical protein [Lachnospiraceae bacterium]